MNATILMISQLWLRWWLGAVRQQAITWANVNPDLCRQMAALGLIELNHYLRPMLTYFQLWPKAHNSMKWKKLRFLFCRYLRFNDQFTTLCQGIYHLYGSGFNRIFFMWLRLQRLHMSLNAYQITGILIVCSTAYKANNKWNILDQHYWSSLRGIHKCSKDPPPPQGPVIIAKFYFFIFWQSTQ